MSLFHVNNPDTDVSTSPQANLPQAPNAVVPQPPAWPAKMNLYFILGTTRIILRSQQLTVHLVIGDGIDNLRVSLVFVNAFPDGAHTLEFIRKGLLSATEGQGVTAAAIHQRLQDDEAYYSAIAPTGKHQLVTDFISNVLQSCKLISHSSGPKSKTLAT